MQQNFLNVWKVIAVFDRMRQGTNEVCSIVMIGLTESGLRAISQTV